MGQSPDAPSASSNAASSKVRLLPAGTELPYEGGPIPPGASIGTKGNPALFWSGLTMLLVGYIPPVLIGVAALAGGAAMGLGGVGAIAFIGSLIPLLNSLYVSAAVNGAGPELSAILGLLDLGLQVGGIVMIVVEKLTRFRILHYDQEGPEPAVRFTVLPGVRGTPAGLTLAGAF